jgi:hypothetical protein
MKKIAILTVVLLGYAVLFGLLYTNNKKNREIKERLDNNVKYYQRANKYLLLNIVDLKASKDSADIRINELTKSLSIKPKTIEKVIYSKDFLVLKDTIYFENLTDTTKIVKQNEFYKLELEVVPPIQINHSLEIYNELIIVEYITKERINEKKTWLGKLFQKKYKVTNIEIKQTNPYIKNLEEKKIKICNQKK